MRGDQIDEADRVREGDCVGGDAEHDDDNGWDGRGSGELRRKRKLIKLKGESIGPHTQTLKDQIDRADGVRDEDYVGGDPEYDAECDDDNGADGRASGKIRRKRKRIEVKDESSGQDNQKSQDQIDGADSVRDGDCVGGDAELKAVADIIFCSHFVSIKSHDFSVYRLPYSSF